MPSQRKSNGSSSGRKTNTSNAKGRENKEYKAAPGSGTGKKPRFSKPRNFDKKEGGFKDAPQAKDAERGERRFDREDSSNRRDNKDSRGFAHKEGGYSSARGSNSKTDNDPREKRERAGFKKDSNSRKSEFAYNPDRPVEKSLYEDRSGKKKGHSDSRDKRSGSGEKRFDRNDSSEKRSFSRDSDSRGGERSFKRDDASGRKSFSKDGGSGEKRFNRNDSSEKRSFSRDSDSRGGDRNFKKDDSSERKSFSKDSGSGEKRFDRNDSSEKRSFSRDTDSRGGDPKYKKDDSSERKSFSKDSGYGEKRFDNNDSSENKQRSFKRDDSSERAGYKGKSDKGSFSKNKNFDKPKSASKSEKKHSLKKEEGQLRLNRYLSNSGVCSRREADEYITAGAVSVNGKVITEMGFQVMPGDMVKYGGAILNPEKPVYLLLNKPKGFITTVSDPRDRKTVMSLIAGACRERIVPVGRLDRNTTGLLLFTNDGDMLKKLTHPKHGVNKIYHVETDIPVKKADITKMLEGVELEDGIAKADNVSYVDAATTKKEIGIELHSGKNRIVRRMVSSFGYEVITLDRVYFAGLTKKNLPRGHYRFLTEKEINILKMIS